MREMVHFTRGTVVPGIRYFDIVSVTSLTASRP